MRRNKLHSAEFKQAASRRLLAGEDVASVAEDLGIDRRRLYEWVERVRLNGIDALRGPGRPSGREGKVLTPLRGPPPSKGELAQRRIVELERKVAQQELDLDFFRQALRHVKARQQEAAGGGRLRSSKSSKR